MVKNGACGKYGRDHKCKCRFGCKAWRNLEDLGVQWKIIIKLIFNKKTSRTKLNTSASEQGKMAASCKHDNNLSSSTELGNFLTSWKTINFSEKTDPCSKLICQSISRSVSYLVSQPVSQRASHLVNSLVGCLVVYLLACLDSQSVSQSTYQLLLS